MKGFLNKNPVLLILLLACTAIKVFSLNPVRVERYYTYGLYPLLSKFLRITFGWLPFSVGDILYFLAFCYLLYAFLAAIRLLRKRGVSLQTLGILFNKIMLTTLWVYLIFNILWGINYDRVGIAGQLQLDVQPYTIGQLDTLATVLQERLNYYAERVDTATRPQLNKNSILFKKGVTTYRQVAQFYPFLTYQYPSIKPSMYSYVGQYFGFTGYYNPFTGEAQLKTSVPSFLKPFIVTHEIAHQLGYGKENEANFVGYLACQYSNDVNFLYSAYFELFWYAVSDLNRKKAKWEVIGKLNLQPRVWKDYNALVRYLISTENPIEPYMTKFYDQFLKLNNQPKGTQTYNQVVAWLIAYQKKYGIESI